MGQINLLVLEDSTLREIARDPRFTHIPCVQSYNGSINSAKGQCARCKRKLQTAVGQAMQGLANCLTSLPPNLRNDVKRLLNARQLRAVRTNSKGQRIVVTF
jgi:hypothetical protein